MGLLSRHLPVASLYLGSQVAASALYGTVWHAAFPPINMEGCGFTCADVYQTEQYKIADTTTITIDVAFPNGSITH
jgi:hypothetical protein